MYEILFLDLDDTILDYRRQERLAVEQTFAHFGVTPTDDLCRQYIAIGDCYWKMVEQQAEGREELAKRRYTSLLQENNVPAVYSEFAGQYTDFLSTGHFFLPGAEEAVERLSKKYRLFLASNGGGKIQAGRLKSANIMRFFENRFVSELIGVSKPAAEFFQRSFAQIPDFDKSKAMMVGDSLTSDMKGGLNAGLTTCWINPRHLPRDPQIPVDYETESLAQLEALLETL